MSFVFISYSRQDLGYARDVATLLENQRIDVWWDYRLVPGDTFHLEIENKIREAQCVIVIWSDRSCVSHWVVNEARLANSLNKLVPVRLPSLDFARVPLDLRHLHCVDIQQTDAIARALSMRFPETASANIVTPDAKVGYSPLAGFCIPAFDTILEKKSKKYCERLKKFRAQVLPSLENIPITNYSHNSVSHAVQCTNLVTELFSAPALENLSEVELFILGAFCFVHDVGMASRPGMTPEQVYRAHNVYAQDFIMALRKEDILNELEAASVAALCLMHNKDLERARTHFKAINAEGARLPVVYSAFRVADMLDVETQPGEILRIKPEIVSQVIGELEFDPGDRKITIWRGHDIGDTEFLLWSRFFDTRLQSLNDELRQVDGELIWEVA